MSLRQILESIKEAQRIRREVAMGMREAVLNKVLVRKINAYGERFDEFENPCLLLVISSKTTIDIVFDENRAYIENGAYVQQTAQHKFTEPTTVVEYINPDFEEIVCDVVERMKDKEKACHT